MALTPAAFAERVFALIGGGEQNPQILDGIIRGQVDALQLLAEQVADSPLKHLLTLDFQIPSVGGVCQLSGTTLVGGASLASANIYNILFDTIPRGKALHPDSLQPIQWGGSTLDVDCPRWLTLGFINGTISANTIYLRNEDGSTPTDQNVIFKASYCPTLAFFATPSATLAQLESSITGMAQKIMMPAPAAQPGMGQ